MTDAPASPSAAAQPEPPGVDGQRVRRRLAAILACDVVGYSRLMEDDEDGTLAAFKAHLGELIEPAIAERNGRIFKTTGDGLLAEFASAVDAVSCAQQIQDGMAARNDGIDADEAIELRIGVNVGDVIVEDDDVYGGGVNVAARLERVAEPGRVLISGTAYDQVLGKLDLGFAEIGEQRFRNIDEPVRAYRVFSDPDEAAAFNDDRDAARNRTRRRLMVLALVVAVGAAFAWANPWREAPAPVPAPEPEIAAPVVEEPPSIEEVPEELAPKPSVAVLPFSVASEDEADLRLADGFSTGIADALAGLDGLFTVSPGSTRPFADVSVPRAEIARELGVVHLVEGRIEVGTQRFSVSARLVEAATGEVVTTVTRNGARSEALALRAIVTRQIASALAAEPTPSEALALERLPSSDVAAWELYLQGRELVTDRSRQTGRDALIEARTLFRAAIARDPTFADAYAGLSTSHSRAVDRGLSEAPGDDLARAIDFATTAISIDAGSLEGLLALAHARLAGGRMDDAIALYETALRVAPGNSEAHARIALALAFTGRPDEGIEHARRAVELDPLDPTGRYRNAVAFTNFAAARYEDALEAWAEAGDEAERAPGITALVAAAHAALGNEAGAEAARTRLLAAAPDFRISEFQLLRPFGDDERERIGALLREAGMPE